MGIEKHSGIVSRIFFVGAFVLLALAVIERVLNLFGYTFLMPTSYTAGRLLEFAAILLVFVVALLLRQIREELRKS